MNHSRARSRRGTLIFCVLACLLIAGGMVATTTQMALRHRRSVRQQEQLRQTELLLDAGILRAARLLRDSDTYQGEVWRPADAIERFTNAQVEIQVTNESQESDQREVTVIASLGHRADRASQDHTPLTRRTFAMRINVASAAPNSESSEPASSDSETPNPEPSPSNAE